jgi:hypothetical protein
MEPTIPSPTHPPALPPGACNGWLFAVRILLWLVAGAWVLFGLSWIVLHGWIVPRIGEFRPRLEIEASKALGVPVRIGEITAHSQGMIPVIRVARCDPARRPGPRSVALPRLLGALSPSSIWGLGLSSFISTSPSSISAALRTEKSTWAGWMCRKTARLARALQPTGFFPDRIRDAWRHRALDRRVAKRANAGAHAGRLGHAQRAAPPPHAARCHAASGMGRPVYLQGRVPSVPAVRRAGDFDGWTGQLFADFTRVDASRVRQYLNMDTLGVELIRGNGALRAWADVSKGQIIGGTADVALQDVDARLGAKLQPLAFESVAGRIGGGQRANGFDFNTEGLRFRTRDGLQWPGGNVALVHTGEEAGAPQHTEFKADRLDLAALAQIANRLPLDAPTHGSLPPLPQRTGGDRRGPLAGAAGRALHLRGKRASGRPEYRRTAGAAPAGRSGPVRLRIPGPAGPESVARRLISI